MSTVLHYLRLRAEHTMITIPPPLIREMQDHAFACYPGECCGLLFAQDGSDEACRCVPLDNLADKLHAMDPLEYPRTSRDWFAPNEAKLGRLVRDAEAVGERWLALFHSHVDCSAYFSDEDKRYAAPDGAAVYPQLYQTVIDCQPHGIVDAKSFRWDGADYALIATHSDFARPRPEKRP